MSKRYYCIYIILKLSTMKCLLTLSFFLTSYFSFSWCYSNVSVLNVFCFFFQVVLWIQQNFLLPSEITAKNGELDLTFLSARTQLPLQITMSSGGAVSFACSIGLHIFFLHVNTYVLDSHKNGHTHIVEFLISVTLTQANVFFPLYILCLSFHV